MKALVKIMITLAHSQTYGKHLVAEQRIKKGTVFHQIKNYRVLPYPTSQSLQINADKHICWEKYVLFLNNSCDPNTIVNVESLELCAIRDIEEGEQITMFYPSTEWELHRPFDCLCNSKQCLGVIRGAKYLSESLLSQYFINRHIYIQKREIDSHTKSV
ncbi:MAG: SET domain-containing protein-lysine N-methyltransferase [Nostoc sp.]|uniref:SET domain-containing protein-lysine N-methyltransferase n=1 Tax=Nostoc sp. TaxID=1180 RepID=UPI002FFA271B